MFNCKVDNIKLFGRITKIIKTLRNVHGDTKVDVQLKNNSFIFLSSNFAAVWICSEYLFLSELTQAKCVIPALNFKSK